MDGRGSEEDVGRRRPVGALRRAAVHAVPLLVAAVLVLFASGEATPSGAVAASPSESLIQQFPKLIGPEGTSGRFGDSVALSGDGSTGLVGSPYAGGAGGASVLLRSEDGAWTEGPQLWSGEFEEAGGGTCDPGSEGEEEEECRVGRSVALSANGQTALVGGPRTAGACVEGGTATRCVHQGKAWVFVRSGSTWTLAATLSGGVEETPEGHFGRSLALSADGSTAIVGAPTDRGARGAAWVFKRSGSGWAQDGPALWGGEATGEVRFGHAVALSADGETALVGGPGNASYAGAAWVFVRSGGGWSQQGGRLSGGGEESGAGQFGSSVALSGDGTTALVGARADSGFEGAAWVFARSAGAWEQQGPRLSPPGWEGAPEQFGYAVALSGDGSTALIGAPQAERSAGQVWELQRAAGSWAAPARAIELLDEAGKGWAGTSAVISADGSSALVGGPMDGYRTGAVWALARGVISPPVVTGLSRSSGPEAGGTAVTITGANLGNATSVEFGGATAKFRILSPESITATSPAGTGTVDVTVASPAGVSASSPADRFTYGAAHSSSPPGSEQPPQGEPAPPSQGRMGVLDFGPVSSPGGSRCTARLVSSQLAVIAHGRVTVRLRRVGSGRCGGRLMLTAREARRRRHPRSRTLGVGAFVFGTGSTTTVRVALDSAGRSLLRAGHGRLSASLSVTTPSGAGRAHVRLTAVGVPVKAHRGG